MNLPTIFYKLKSHKKKHSLHTEINSRYDGTIEFTIYDEDNWNNFVYFYDFDTDYSRSLKFKRCLEYLESEEEALKFIRGE